MKKELLPIFLLILLSGCVKMSATQELNRDGTMNVVVLINSPYQAILDSINGSIDPNPSLKPYSERINNTLIYYFSKADPFNEDLFLPKNESADLSINPSGFLAGNTFRYYKEFRFPYYYYFYYADFSQPSIDGKELFNESGLIELSSEQSITYDIIYFGELVNTNAEELSNNKVRFYANNFTIYNLTFKEFFLNNWLMRIID